MIHFGDCCNRHNQALEQHSVDMQEGRVSRRRSRSQSAWRFSCMTSSSTPLPALMRRRLIEKVLNMLHAFITQVHFHSFIPALSPCPPQGSVRSSSLYEVLFWESEGMHWRILTTWCHFYSYYLSIAALPQTYSFRNLFPQ